MELEIKNLSKSYGSVRALQNAGFTAKSGEVRALLGGNGSGKSTLIKVVSGLVSRGGGEIFIDGKRIDVRTPKAAKKLGIVATSQELSILPNLSVGENIALCAIPKRTGGFTDRRKIRERSMEVLKRLGLEHRIDTPVSHLPINEQYLIEFGKAIFQDFDILMVDEVTSALYSSDVLTVKRILDEYKALGKIIVFVSHRMKELHMICDSVTVMRNGEVIETCPMKQADDDYLLSLMIGETAKEEQKVPFASSPAPNAPPMITVHNLPVRRYRTSLNLEIGMGEIIGIAGLQGHGQSDLVRSLFGIKGKITVSLGGADVSISHPRAAAHRRFAFLSGDREKEGAFRQHSIADNLTVVQELIHKDKTKKPADVLAGAGVKYRGTSDLITSLSGGNQQKVIVSRWTCAEPVLLLADDPSKGIDVQARKELQGTLRSLAARGAAILFVSSDDDELVDLCSVYPHSRVIVMYEGEIVETLTGSNITRDNIITATLARKEGVSAL